MFNLSERTKTLLLMGAESCGNFTNAFNYVEESLYVNEVVEMREFCEWIDNKVGGAGSGNIDKLYKAFKTPQDMELQAFVKETAEKINYYRNL